MIKRILKRWCGLPWAIGFCFVYIGVVPVAFGACVCWFVVGGDRWGNAVEWYFYRMEDYIQWYGSWVRR